MIAGRIRAAIRLMRRDFDEIVKIPRAVDDKRTIIPVQFVKIKLIKNKIIITTIVK